MVPAFGMVILPQNLSTGNGQIPGCSCILSVAVAQEELREHALAHASVVVLLLSKHDVDTIETLSQRLASNQEITNLRGFKTIVELVVILELVHRRVVRKLVPLLVATSDHMSKTTDFKALDLTKLALRRIKDIASTQVQATSKEILGRMTKDSELHLWESQITLRGLVHAATDNNNRGILGWQKQAHRLQTKRVFIGMFCRKTLTHTKKKTLLGLF